MIYTTVDFYRDNELWQLDGYPFWLRSVAGHPSDVYPGQRWHFWQYTGTGLVEGIDGPTDLNVFAGTRAPVGCIRQRALGASWRDDHRPGSLRNGRAPASAGASGAYPPRAG